MSEKPTLVHVLTFTQVAPRQKPYPTILGIFKSERKAQYALKKWKEIAIEDFLDDGINRDDIEITGYKNVVVIFKTKSLGIIGTLGIIKTHLSD